MLLKIVFISLIAVAYSQSQDDLDRLIGETFTDGLPFVTPEPIEQTHVQPGERVCSGEYGQGVCVPYYLCNNGTINTNGEGIFDIRLGEETDQCLQTFDECCRTGDVVTKVILPEDGFPTHEKCGYRNVGGAGIRITGNSLGETDYGEFPWQLAVLSEELIGDRSVQVYQGGGSLIHPSVALTAAHCVQGKNVATLSIRAGEWDTQTKNELFPHVDASVQDVVIHKKYYKGGLHYDFALLFLENQVLPAPHINTICLPPQGSNYDYSRCFATGWGKNEFGREGKYQTILKKVELPIVPFNDCEQKFRNTRLGSRFRLHESFLCAGGEAGRDVCTGDGGSPLVCPIPGQEDYYVQVGVVAWGLGCGVKDVPGAYADVTKVTKWIDEELAMKGFFL